MNLLEEEDRIDFTGQVGVGSEGESIEGMQGQVGLREQMWGKAAGIEGYLRDNMAT